jgi:hypothetical protein
MGETNILKNMTHFKSHAESTGCDNYSYFTVSQTNAFLLSL